MEHMRRSEGNNERDDVAQIRAQYHACVFYNDFEHTKMFRRRGYILLLCA